MSIKDKDRKLLWGKSGNRCALCKMVLVESGKVLNIELIIGEEAHIEGNEPGSARYNDSMSEKDRNGEQNLILLCPNDHSKIDKNYHDYSVDNLKEIKKDHEKWIYNCIRSEMPNVSFSELETVIKYLISTNSNSDESIKFIKPREKISRNRLGVEVEHLIIMGMSRVGEVKNFLNINPDQNYANRLKEGIINKYNEFYNADDANSIFFELLNYSTGNVKDIKITASALAVIVYFFESCDIFSI